MSIISNTRFSTETIAVGGEVTTVLLIIFIVTSLLLLDSKYWNRYISYTYSMCSDSLLLTFTAILIAKIIFVI